MNSTIANLAEQTAGCGEIITWTVRGAFVKRTQFENELRNEGLKCRVKQTRTATYLQRALHQCVADSLVRKIGENDKYVAYAALHEEGNLTQNQYTVQVKEAVRLNKTNGELEFRIDNSLTRAIRESMATNEGGLLSAEMGHVFKQCISTDANGIGLRDAGGVYFVPATHKHKVDALERAIDKVRNSGSKIKLQRLRVYAGDREVQDIAEMLGEAVMTDVRAIVEEVKEALRDLTKAKPSTFVKRAATIRSTIKKLADYEQVLAGIKFTAESEKCNKLLLHLKKVESRCRAERANARKNRRGAIE